MRILLSSLLLAGSTVAQWSVVPGSIPGSDGNSMALVAGFHFPHRHQFLYDDALLRPTLIDRDLVGIAFRRDASVGSAFAGGEADLVITLSIAPRPSRSASETMDDNHDPIRGNRVEVFRGRIVIPASAAPANRSVGWSDPQDVVEVPFTAPFRYRGGTLCIDLVGAPVPGRETRFWAVDAIADVEARGAVVSVGDACGPFGGRRTPTSVYETASVAEGELTPGGSATIQASGDPGQNAVLLIGVAPLAIDLRALGVGGAGCVLRVDAFAALATSFVDDAPYAMPGGTAGVGVHLPDTAALLGARFLAQFAQMSAPLLTSNALHCTVSTTRSTLGGAIVSAPWDEQVLPVRGRVLPTRIPVVRIRT